MHRIDPSAVCPQAFSRPLQLAALERFLGDAEIETICRQLGHAWRRRDLPPGVTARSLVFRSLHPDRSIQAVVLDLAAAGHPTELGPSASAWCQARSRLPAELWPRLLERSVQRLRRSAGHRHLVAGRPLYVIDGSTLSMPDTPQLVQAFGYAHTRHGPSRFPVARLTVITLAGVEAVCDYRLGPYRADENHHFHQMWRLLPPGGICLFDRHFSSFYNLAKLHQRHIDVVTRLHQRRNPWQLIARGRPLRKNQWLITLDLAPQLRRRYDDPTLPAALRVRLIRVVFRRGHHRRQLWLVTTLLSPRQDPAATLVNLYRRRWGIETRLAALKTTLEMNVLRSTSLRGVRHEVAATLLAHNLVWTIIHQAAQAAETPADRISFANAVKAVLAFSATLRLAPRVQRRPLYHALLAQIVRRTNRQRPGRVEPRLLKRETARFAFLRIPRDEARRKCLT